MWDNATTGLPGGAEGTGPLAVMAPSGGAAVVISAASSFMATSQEFIAVAQPAKTYIAASPVAALHASAATSIDAPQWQAHANSYCDAGGHSHWAYE